MPGHPFYTTATWRKFREVVISKNGGVCKRCNTVFTDTSQLELHHIKPLKGNDYNNPAKAYAEGNIEVICHKCHNEEHGRFVTGQEVFLIFGPPLSGKSSYVKEQKLNNDIVVDIDALEAAITLNDRYTEAPAIRYNLFAIRDNLLDQIKTRHGKWKRAWIIGGYANAFDRDRLIDELHIDRTILMDATKEQCYERLENTEDLRSERIDEFKGYIDKWFREYTPPLFSESQ